MTARLVKILRQYPFYLFLLPVFFVLHNFMLYYGLVSAGVAWVVLFKVELIFFAVFFAVRQLTRNVQRSAAVVMLAGIVVLFYGVLKDFLSQVAGVPILARYSILLPFLVIISVLAIARILKKQDFNKSNFFQNTVLLLFLVAEGVTFLFSGAGTYLQQNQLVRKSVVNEASIQAGGQRPDVYFLVFDSYPGTAFLKKLLQYNNTILDDGLTARGFYLAANSRSNYIHTALSIASTLNFQYLQNIAVNKAPEPKQYRQASLSIQNAMVPIVFNRMGYRLYNLSIFDIGKQPALERENFLVLPEQDMLLYNTLGARFSRDVLWNFSALVNRLLQTEQDKRSKIAVIEKQYTKKRDYNKRVFDSLIRIPSEINGQPKFVYAHFYLPHPPFFYDREGLPLNRDFDAVVKSMEDKQSFLSYLEYTNNVILKITDSILQNSTRPPVIIIQSDHGYRDFKKDKVAPEHYFENYAAFYFPDRDYKMLYDSLSNVNTFPVIFNKYFNAHVPFQKDLQVFTKY